MTSSLVRWQFHPPLWAVFGTLLGVAAMTALGGWQYQRGQQKQQLINSHASAMHRLSVELRSDTPAPATGELLHVRVHGRFDVAKGVLLDNQSYRHQPGVHAWTPLILDDGSVMIVDRGWLPLSAGEPPVAPEPSYEAQTLEGYWRSLPRPGMRLGTSASACGVKRPTVINYPDSADCRCLFGPLLREGLLELSPDAPDGFVRDWQAGGADAIPPQRHYGYAAQWWAFALTLLGIFIKLNVRKSTS